MHRRQVNLLAATLLAGGFTSAGAQEQAVTRYGVLSLIGRKLDIVTAQPTTGTHLDPNLQDMRELPDDTFDIEALRVVQAGVRSAVPGGGQVLLYKSRSADLPQRAVELFDGNKVRIPDELLAQMKADGATRLLMITRHRQEAELKAAHSRVGDGRLEGMGYFVNYHQRMHRSDTGETGIGFLAPYVYLRLSLVDLETGSLLAEQYIRGSTTFSAARAKEGVSPWDVLNAQEKLNTLLRIMGRELRAAVPKVLAAGPAPNA